MKLDDMLIFDGEIARFGIKPLGKKSVGRFSSCFSACGGLIGGSEAFGDVSPI